MELMEAIKTRRSIRKYKPDPVDDNTLEIVLDAARWAPSWANTQCWRFIVVRDREVKAQLADALREGNPATTAIKEAPIVIVACAEKGKAGFYKADFYHKEPRTNKGDWLMFDVGLAMQNLVLAAHSLGLGTVHVGSFNAERAENILGVPEGFCAVEMTPLGYPDHEGRAPSRKELLEIVFYDKFGANKS